MTASTSAGYAALLRRMPPRIIKTEAQNENYIRILEQLERGGRLNADEKEFAELLTLLIEDFEEKHYRLSASSPVQVLRELMETNGLKQKDLIDVFGTESIVSEVLNQKRELNKDHIKRLSHRFHVSPELFF